MKKRIIYITRSFPYGKGETSFILPEIKLLSLNYDITIISRNSYDTQTTELNENIEILRYPEDQVKLKNCLYYIYWLFSFDVLKEIVRNHNRSGYFLKTIKHVLRAAHFSNYIKKIRKKYHQKIIYYTYWNDYASYGIASMKRKNDYAITRIHGGDLYLRPTNNYSLPLKAKMAKGMDRIIFISEDGREYFIKTFHPRSNDNLIVRYMGVENSYGIAQKSSDKVLRILSLSNIVYGKRIEKIIETLSIIKNITIEWTHIGDGEEKDQVLQLAHKLLDSKKNIKYSFTGMLSNLNVRKFIETHPIDMLLNVSSSEGLPVSMMEAASYGIPIIGTDVGGVREIISEKNGILINRDFTIKELANILIKFSKFDNKKINNMRFESRKIWEDKFRADKNYKKFLQEVNSLWEK